jgi:hypothetical protein
MKKFSPIYRLTLIVSSLSLAAVTFTGCKTVDPWERGILAEQFMNPDRDPLRNALAEHMWFSREAASGGRGIGGGGCGCN